jgi:2-furoate---CoA ligase
MRLSTLLELAAERDPHATAIVDGDRRWTYAEWRARVVQLARALRASGVAPGDRVVLCLRNREETAALHLACQQIEAITTPLNFRLASGEIAYCIGDAAPRLVVYEDHTARAVLGGRAQWGCQPELVALDTPPPPDGVSFDALLARGAAAPPLPPTPADADDRLLGLILYTSGTTGRPKGVPRTQRAEYAAAVAHAVQNRYARGESTLGAMPLYHTMGMRSLLTMLLLNGKYVAVREFEPAAALAVIARERISALYLVPTAYHALLADPAAATADLASVRKLGYAGASMTTSLEARCRERFQPEVFINHYGSTEIYTFTVNDDLVRKPGCAGRPGLHSRLRVVRPDPERNAGPDELVPDGEVGELIAWLGSDEAFAGYWHRPDADARAIRDGWYFTGDLGYRDADGDYWVTGRVDDMIITGGENVYPIEVEDVLARHPDVAEVAVVGLPDEKWGQVVTAFVVPRRPDLTAAELDAHCRASPDLADFKRPRRVVFVRAIPKSPVGKILRRLLLAGEYEPLA